MRDLKIFEKYYVCCYKIRIIATFNQLSTTRISQIIEKQRYRYENTFNYLREIVFGMPPLTLTKSMINNHDALVALESWIELQKAVIQFMLDRTGPNNHIEGID